ncbi:MAG: ABC transporter permease [Proteobacteria bacterium]|nr:ABC transporter permease [Pseudomonadota bacterium]
MTAETEAPELDALDSEETSLGSLLATLGRVRESPIAMIGLAIVIFWILVALFAPLLAPMSPTATILPMAPPGTRGPGGQLFLLGADHLGRDVLSRIIFGARTVLIYAPIATASAYTVGVVAGLLAGYRQGWMDELLSRVSDLILAFPALVLYIVIIAKFGSSGANIIIAVTLASGPAIMRIVRGMVLDIRSRAFIAAAQVRGESTWYIMFAEILPNATGPLIVDSCLRLGYVIVTIGTLGFLGLGLPPPAPDWGGMINETRQFAMIFPHMVVFPCIAVSSLVLGLNLFADGLGDVAKRA